MKLTWFAGTTIRIHIGGQILVADPGLAPTFVDSGELVSGADHVFTLATEDATIPDIDASAWRPRPLPKLIDESTPQAVALYRIAAGAILVDAAGEPPLVLLAGTSAPRFGRWATDAVVVLCGASEALVVEASVLLDVSPPKLVAIAADEAGIDLAIAELREHLDGTALISLEPGLALEV
jgi:hypothetical protein